MALCLIENHDRIIFMTEIKTFIFDCYGVVFSPVLDLWYKEHRLSHGFVDENFKKILRKNDLGIIDESDVANYFSKYEGVNSTPEKIEREIDTYLKLNRVLIDYIRKIKNKGFKTVLLTNANVLYFEKEIYPNYPDFKSFFDEIIISSVVGMVKPDADIYQYALKKINCRPEEALFIDDTKINVDAAIALGINGFLYTDNISFADYVKKLGINLEE